MPRGHVVTEFNRALKCQVQERNLTYDNVNQTQKKEELPSFTHDGRIN